MEIWLCTLVKSCSNFISIFNPPSPKPFTTTLGRADHGILLCYSNWWVMRELSWFALSDAQKVGFVLSSRKNTGVINSLSPIIWWFVGTKQLEMVRGHNWVCANPAKFFYLLFFLSCIVSSNIHLRGIFYKPSSSNWEVQHLHRKVSKASTFRRAFNNASKSLMLRKGCNHISNQTITICL